MASLNKVILLGNLTRDPEMRYTPNGTAVSTFGLAINRRYRQGDEWRDDVCYVDIVTFGRQAETVGEYLSKGSPILIEGRLKLDTWEADGQKRSKLKVVGERMQFIGGRGESGGQQQSRPPQHSEFESQSGRRRVGVACGSNSGTVRMKQRADADAC